MKVEIFNWEILQRYLLDISFSKGDLERRLREQFSVYNISELGIIFVEDEYIHTLNREYRGKDYVTDVLSFNISAEPLIGEVYIAPCYISKNTAEEGLEEEILRNIVHGTLHIAGYDHKEKFREEAIGAEEMFLKQEEILLKLGLPSSYSLSQ